MVVLWWCYSYGSIVNYGGKVNVIYQMNKSAKSCSLSNLSVIYGTI